MADTEDIILRIALSGQDDVVARLGQIGDAGVSVFERLERAVTGGSAVFAGLTTALAGVGAGLFAWANSSSNAVDHMSNLAAQSGTTISQMSALTQTLSAAGANTDQLGSAFRRLGFTIEAEWQQIAQAVKKGVNDAINEEYKLKDASLAVEDAQEKLYQAQVKSQELQGFKQDAQEKQAHELANAYREEERALNDLAKAQQAQREAQEAAEERRKNDPNTLKDAVKAIVEGRQTYTQAAQDANLSYNNVIKGIIASAGPAADALNSFNGNLSDLITKAPSVKEVFYQLADFFKNSGDDALNTAVAYKVLGRGIGQDVIEALKQGSAALKENEERLTRLGLVLDDTNKKVAKDFIQSFHSLSGELVTTIQQIGTFFAPAFTQGFDTFRKFIEDNHQSILDFAQDIANRIKPIILDFFSVISGRDAQTEWIQNFVDGLRRIGSFIKTEVVPAIVGFFNALTGGESDPGSRAEVWQKRFEAFGKAIKSVFDIVSGVISTLISGLDKVADIVNKVFGTNLTGGDIAIVAILAKVTGALNALTTAAGAAFGAMGRLLGLGGGAVAGGVAAGAAGVGVNRLQGLANIGADPASYRVLSGAATGQRLVAGAEAAGLDAGQLRTLLSGTASNPGAIVGGLITGLAQGAAQGIGAVLTGLFVTALGSPGLIAAVGAGIGALFVLAGKSAYDRFKDEEEKRRKGQAETPANEIPLPGSELEYLLGLKPAQTPEEFREEQRVRRLSFSADRGTAEQELTESQRQGRTLYLEGRELSPSLSSDSRLTPGARLPSGREFDLRAMRDQFEADYFARIQRQEKEQEQSRATLRGPGVPSTIDTTRRGIDNVPRPIGSERTEPYARDFSQGLSEAADRLRDAAQEQKEAADKQSRGIDTSSKNLPTETLEEYERRTGAGERRDYYLPQDTGKRSENLDQLDQSAEQVNSSFSQLDTAIDSVSIAFESAAAAIEEASTQFASAAESVGSDTATFAEGGLISGPGGPKEDRVPIMASPGEFMVAADGSNLGDAIRHFGRRFAEGGLVEGLLRGMPLPGALGSRQLAFESRLAGGGNSFGLQSALRPFQLNLGGGVNIGGMYATPRAVSELQRAAVDQRTSSIGRKPPWYVG